MFPFRRDRELQIATIEQTTSNHHRLNENDAGKSYLLETYLNGIHPNSVDNNRPDPIIAKETTTVNSDSGVHTEDATPTISPTHNTDADNEDADNNTDTNGKHQLLKRNKATMEMAQSTSSKRNQHHRHHHTKRKHHTTSKRETKLLKDHECSKEFLASIKHASSSGTADVSDNEDDACSDESNTDCSRQQVMALQKLVAVNKHLQREEELLVRLMAKVRKYECDMPDNMSAVQIRGAIEQVNRNITISGDELHRMEMEIENFGELLSVKSDVVHRLSRELEQLEIGENVSGTVAPPLAAVATATAAVRYRLPDDVILRQAPLYFQKDDCGIAAVNLHCDQRNVNKFAATGMDNAKVGPKKLLNEFRKDQELLVTYAMAGDSALLGTLV